MADAPSLSIVVVSYNVRDALDVCLASVASADGARGAQVLVVDNGSTDGTLAMLDDRWPGVRVLAGGGQNIGFGAACNRGVREAGGELVLLLNPDTVVTDAALSTLIAALVTHPGAGAVGPRLVDAGGRPELSFGPAVSPLGELRQQRLMARYARGARGAVERVERWTSEPGPRQWLTAACLLIRRTDFEAVGGFDERFFMYYEDVDLCVRLRQRGRDVRFVPSATVQHLRGASGGSNPELARRRRESQLAYYQKHHPRWVPALRWYLWL